MNLTNADKIMIKGKEVQSILFNGNLVYSRGPVIRLTVDKSIIKSGENVDIHLRCDDLKDTEIELYKVIGLTRIYLDTLETDSSGKATYDYVGDGSGTVGFVAVYDEKESNIVTIEDYTPVLTYLMSVWTPFAPQVGNFSLKAYMRDQHMETMHTSGVSISCYVDSTLIDTKQTDNNGEATFDLSNIGAGTHSISLISGSVRNDYTVTIPKLNTSLNIEVPALIYSDNFNVTGLLKDANNNPVLGATVRLKWTVGGQENSTTQTTNANGEVTFATQAPTSITNYTFKLEFDGNSDYNNSSTSVVEKTVGKETSVLSISSPASPASVSGSNFIMTGTLFDNDGEPLEDAEIKITQYVASIPATVTIATAEVDENGDWSCEVPTNYMSDGDNTITVQYDGNIVYTTAVQSFTVRKVSFDGITLSSDKSILSYVDNDSATLTAQLTYNDVPVSVSGETVTFEVRKQSDDSLVETLTADTNSSGIATVSYLGKGVGDLYIKAECMSLIQTYAIEDIYWYSNDGTKLTGTYTTGSDSSYNYITSIGTNVEFPHIPTGDFELSMKAYRPTTTSGRALLLEFGTSKSDTLLCGWDEGNTSTTKNCRIYRRSGSSNTSVQNNTNPDYNNGEWVDFKLRFEEGTVTLTIGGTSISTTRSSVSRIGNYSQTTSRLSEFKIKSL